jgi:hypothetical protein
MIIQITAFIIAVIAYTISQLQQHGKLKWSKALSDYWSNGSGIRKYKTLKEGDDVSLLYRAVGLYPPPDNWYYNFFKISHKERFPGSATIFVSFTDGYHLMQMFFKAFLSIAIAGISWWAVAWFVAWSCIFTVVYKYLSK